MATITNAITIDKSAHGTNVRYRFRYELDNGELHYARAWVPANVDEATERSARGAALLEVLAAAEIEQVMDQ
jgi:hypothetical protein